MRSLIRADLRHSRASVFGKVTVRSRFPDRDTRDAWGKAVGAMGRFGGLSTGSLLPLQTTQTSAIHVNHALGRVTASIIGSRAHCDAMMLQEGLAHLPPDPVPQFRSANVVMVFSRQDRNFGVTAEAFQRLRQ